MISKHSIIKVQTRSFRGKPCSHGLYPAIYHICSATNSHNDSPSSELQSQEKGPEWVIYVTRGRSPETGEPSLTFPTFITWITWLHGSRACCHSQMSLFLKSVSRASSKKDENGLICQEVWSQWADYSPNLCKCKIMTYIWIALQVLSVSSLLVTLQENWNDQNEPSWHLTSAFNLSAFPFPSLRSVWENCFPIYPRCTTPQIMELHHFPHSLSWDTLWKVSPLATCSLFFFFFF